MKKTKNIVLILFTILLINGIYSAAIFYNIEVFKDSKKLTGFFLLAISIVLSVIFSIIIYRQKRDVFFYLFFVYVLAGSLVLGVEIYDNKYTDKHQITDSILHYIGWINPINENYSIEYIIQGAISTLIPIYSILSAILVFFCFQLVPKRRKTICNHY